MENQIEVFNDPDIVILKSELKELEGQFLELTNEKEEYENYRKFREQIAKADNSKIVLTKI